MISEGEEQCSTQLTEHRCVRRTSEGEVEHMKRLEKRREQHRARRNSESREHRAARTAKQREQQRAYRSSESEEQRSTRLAKDREKQRARRTCESDEQRTTRLERDRVRRHQLRKIYEQHCANGIENDQDEQVPALLSSGSLHQRHYLCTAHGTRTVHHR